MVGAGNYDFSPTTLVDFRVGYSRYRVNVNPLDISQPLATQFGIPGLNTMPQLNVNGSGAFTGSGATGAGGFTTGYQCNCPLDEHEFIYDYVFNLTKIMGNHAFRFGGTWEHAGNLRLPCALSRARDKAHYLDNAIIWSAPAKGAGGALPAWVCST